MDEPTVPRNVRIWKAGAQSRNHAPPVADTPSAIRHHCHTLGLGTGAVRPTVRGVNARRSIPASVCASKRAGNA
jgi:hypothetical protein